MAWTRSTDLNRLLVSATVYINGSATSLALPPNSEQVIQMPWTPPMPGQYTIQVQAFRQNDSQSVITTPLHVCALNRNDASVAAATAAANGAIVAESDCVVVFPSGVTPTPTLTSTATPWPTILAPTPRPAQHKSGNCFPPPQGCFPYSWIQSQCKCGVP